MCPGDLLYIVTRYNNASLGPGCVQKLTIFVFCQLVSNVPYCFNIFLCSKTHLNKASCQPETFTFSLEHAEGLSHSHVYIKNTRDKHVKRVPFGQPFYVLQEQAVWTANVIFSLSAFFIVLFLGFSG